MEPLDVNKREITTLMQEIVDDLHSKDGDEFVFLLGQLHAYSLILGKSLINQKVKEC